MGDVTEPFGPSMRLWKPDSGMMSQKTGVCRELEPLTDSLVCLCGTDGWGRAEGVGGTRGASIEGGKDASYQVVPHAGSDVPL